MKFGRFIFCVKICTGSSTFICLNGAVWIISVVLKLMYFIFSNVQKTTKLSEHLDNLADNLPYAGIDVCVCVCVCVTCMCVSVGACRCACV